MSEWKLKTMIAPSEKHLEDWIVGYPDRVYSVEQEPDDNWDGTISYVERIVKRQCRLPSGRCDLIVLYSGLRSLSVAAVELKKGDVDSKTVAQCLRYIRDLREIFLRVRYPGVFDRDENPIEWEYKEIGICSELLAQNTEVTGLIIGHSIPDKNLLVACEASNIQVLTYDYDGENYTFEPHGGAYDGTGCLERYDIYNNFAYGAIGEAMRDVIKDRFEDQKRWEAQS